MQSPQVKKHSRQKPQSKASVSPSSSSSAESTSSRSSTVAFVQVDAGPLGTSHEARRAVRVQAAKASAAARKQTIARKLALLRAAAVDEDEDLSQTSDETRSSRLPSAPVSSSSDSAAVSVFEASSPTLSVKFPEHLAPTFPTPLQHAEIPALVDYFLTYFAPSSDGSIDLRGRETVRKQLWVQALNSCPLFHACLLVAGSHAYATRAMHVPMALLSLAKHISIASINTAVMNSLPNEQVEEPVIAAITLLGGWEMEYGEQAVYSTHMRGLQTIVHLRGGLILKEPGDRELSDCNDAEAQGMSSLSDATIDVILSIAYNLSLYVGQEPYFENPKAYVPRLLNFGPHPLAPGLEQLRQQQLFHCSLLNVINALNGLHPADASTGAKIGQIQQALWDWEVREVNATLYCLLQTDLEDRLNGLSHRLVRLAGLALCDSIWPSQALLPLPTSASTGRAQALYSDALALQLELLVGTVYNGVAFWALFVLCAATARCDSRHIRVLRRLRRDLAITTWDALKAWLARFAYPAAALDARAYPLWEAVVVGGSSSAAATAANAAAIDDDATFRLPEPTRYAKGIPHPTLQIGQAISANELKQQIEIPVFSTLR